jgi:hypothetical protein
MRPQAVACALVAVALGAILTYAVTLTMFGISIHTVGVIIMFAGLLALAILLVRSVSGLRRRYRLHRAPLSPGPSANAGYRQDCLRAAAPVAMTRVSTDVYAAPERRRAGGPHSADTSQPPEVVPR